MKIIVPLAGPDFIRADGSLKATSEFNGEPLLRHILRGRAWAGMAAPTDYCFVLRDDLASRDFAAANLNEWYPGSRQVFLSNYTNGAALSAAIGVALVADGDAEPLIIDLADIVYRCESNPVLRLASDRAAGAIGLVFQANDPIYSYLRTENGRFTEAAEKSVISSNASAGTYIFANASIYMRSIAHALENADSQTFNGRFFVCPLFNGVRSQGLEVALHDVIDVVDIKNQ